MKTPILIVEDEAAIADTLLYALETEGYAPAHVSLGAEAVAWVRTHTPALVILDIGLPDQNGFDVCRAIRTFSEVPIVFLTARKEEIDRVLGLELGADDYVVKPFSPRELCARVKAILKRAQSKPESVAKQVGAFVHDTTMQRIRLGGLELALTRYEYRLLGTLMGQPGRIFTREQLMEHGWEAPEASMDRTVDAHIKSLRAKLREIDAQCDVIKTHRGMGYSFEA